MKTKNIQMILMVFVALVSSAALAISFMNMSRKKICFIDNMELMKEFKMTKELDASYQGVSGKRGEIMDSMKLEIQVLEKKIKTGQKDLLDAYKNKVIDYQAVYEKFEKDNQEITAKFNEQVVKQLNQYVKEYGQEKNIDYILGANGTGSLLYAVETNDITKDVIKYVNKRYTGKQ